MKNMCKKEGIKCEVLAKCESFMPGGSLKDRVGKRTVHRHGGEDQSLDILGPKDLAEPSLIHCRVPEPEALAEVTAFGRGRLRPGEASGGIVARPAAANGKRGEECDLGVEGGGRTLAALRHQR